MIAWFAVLSVVPLDAARRKVSRRGLLNFTKEVFFGMVKRQTKRASFAFVNSVKTSCLTPVPSGALARLTNE
jgi:hypothetical protein